MTAWAEQNWKKPESDFSERSDRVTLKLEVGHKYIINYRTLFGLLDTKCSISDHLCYQCEGKMQRNYRNISRINKKKI